MLGSRYWQSAIRPFGHAGEKAIRKWFKNQNNIDKLKNNPGGHDKNKISDIQLADFQKFDGNAQGFRILTSLQDNPFMGGMCLTAATLSTFVKYPKASNATSSSKKVGIFQSELSNFQNIASSCHIMQNHEGKEWQKHPLNYLMEAADDICYLCADIEDAFWMGLFSFEEAQAMLKKMAREYDLTRYNRMTKDGQINYLVAKSIGNLREDVMDAFKENFVGISLGEPSNSLVESINCSESTDNIRKKLDEEVFQSKHMAKIEAMGFEIIEYLLDKLVTAIIDQERASALTHS